MKPMKKNNTTLLAAVIIMIATILILNHGLKRGEEKLQNEKNTIRSEAYTTGYRDAIRDLNE